MTAQRSENPTEPRDSDGAASDGGCCRPLTVALVDSHELIRLGLGRLLDPHPSRIRLVDPAAERDGTRPDLLLLDPFTGPQPDLGSLARLARSGDDGRVVVFTSATEERARNLVTQHGLAGWVSKEHDGPGMVAAFEAVHARTRAGATPAESPAEAHGLTGREMEIVALIASGMTNLEIAQQLFLSINSVKSYIRSAYRKMSVTSRSQAVLWGVTHGLGSVSS